MTASKSRTAQTTREKAADLSARIARLEGRVLPALAEAEMLDLAGNTEEAGQLRWSVMREAQELRLLTTMLRELRFLAQGEEERRERGAGRARLYAGGI